MHLEKVRNVLVPRHVWHLVRDLARSGKGVIVISSELSELLTACDRILVMAAGANRPADGLSTGRLDSTRLGLVI